MNYKTIAIGIILIASSRAYAEQPSAWAPGCHTRLLHGEFDLAKAPRFKVSDEDAIQIKQVLDRMRRDHRAILGISDPPARVIDTVAFQTQFLRTFAAPESNLSDYSYRFQLILDHLSKNAKALEDKRMDWDIWRAYLEFENFADGTNSVETDGYVGPVYSAGDLLWAYLDMNGKSIAGDAQRLHWWLTQLTRDLRAPGGRPLRRWFLLSLVSSQDTLTDKIKPTDDADSPTIQPTPRYPFLEVEMPKLSKAIGSGLGQEERPFVKALAAIASSQQLEYEVWKLNPEKMRPARPDLVSLNRRTSAAIIQWIVDQESWSEQRQELFGTVGSNPKFGIAHLPYKSNDDGIYFFTFNACLYVWPKASMDDAAIQMLRVSKLIDERQRDAFILAGFQKLTTTQSSAR